MIRWPSYPGDYSLYQYYEGCSYERAIDIVSGYSLYGSNVDPYDII